MSICGTYEYARIVCVENVDGDVHVSVALI